jgi:hypothetical protein
MLQVKSTKRISIMVLLLAIAISYIPILLAIYKAPVNVDSSFYLCVLERLYDGHMLYSSIKLEYTPLFFYILLFLKKIFNINISYEFFLSVHFIFQSIAAYFVYKISKEITKSILLSAISVLLFLTVSHWNQGNAILLETPSLTFGVAALYYSIKYSEKQDSIIYIFIGILLSLSFLTKQYGLGFFLLVMFMILFDDEKWIKTSFLLIGLFIPVSICLIVFGKDFLGILDGNGYGVKSVSRVFLAFKIFALNFFPCLIVAFIVGFYKVKTMRDFKLIALLTLGMIGFSLQFYFAGSSHYYLYMVPFASILIVYCFTLINSTILKYLYFALLLFNISYSLYKTYYEVVYKQYIASSHKAYQYKLAQTLKDNIPNNACLYIADIGLVSQYYLTDFIPPNLSTIGYRFGTGLTADMHLKQIKSADYVLKLKKEYYDYGRLITFSVDKYLKDKKCIEPIDGILIFQNR